MCNFIVVVLNSAPFALSVRLNLLPHVQGKVAFRGRQVLHVEPGETLLRLAAVVALHLVLPVTILNARTVVPKIFQEWDGTKHSYGAPLQEHVDEVDCRIPGIKMCSLSGLLKACTQTIYHNVIAVKYLSLPSVSL